jgi:hypothetical protein
LATARPLLCSNPSGPERYGDDRSVRTGRRQVACTCAVRDYTRLVDVDLVLGLSGGSPAAGGVESLRHCRRSWETIAVQLGFVCGALASSILNLLKLVSPKHVILGGSIGATTVNGLLEVAGGGAVGILLRFAIGLFLADIYPPAFKLISTWSRKGRGTALGILGGGIIVGNAMPHLVNGLGGLDWRVVILGHSPGPNA